MVVVSSPLAQACCVLDGVIDQPKSTLTAILNNNIICTRNATILIPVPGYQKASTAMSSCMYLIILSAETTFADQSRR